MKTVFDQATRDELISRINTLTGNSAAQWGKMNVYQMIRHCTTWEEWVAGEHYYKRAFIGFLFGKMALKDFLKDEKPMQRNMPTLPELKIAATTGDIEAEKKNWIAHIQAYDHFKNDNFVHSFFGKMTREQIGQMAYKHTDHHLRQFNS